jgi:hypothetical protein
MRMRLDSNKLAPDAVKAILALKIMSTKVGWRNPYLNSLNFDLQKSMAVPGFKDFMAFLSSLDFQQADLEVLDSQRMF